MVTRISSPLKSASDESVLTHIAFRSPNCWPLNASIFHQHPRLSQAQRAGLDALTNMLKNSVAASPRQRADHCWECLTSDEVTSSRDAKAPILD